MSRVPEPRPHSQGPDLSAYLDGALPSRRAARLRRHLDACGTCRAELAKLRATKVALAGLAPAEPADAWLPQLAARFRAGGPAPQLTHRSRHALQRRLAVTMAGAAALGVGLWLSPPPAAPVTFQEQVGQHVVQIDEPLTDQTSYLVLDRTP